MNRVVRSALLNAAIAIAAVAASGLAHAQVADACALLTPAEIRKISGRSDLATDKPVLSPLKVGSECSNDGKLHIGVYLRPSTKEVFAQIRETEKKYRDYTQEAVSGIGDEAYFMIDKRAVTVKARVGQHAFHVAVDLDGAAPETIKPIGLALAKAAAAKLR